jgi:hypothetical protein
MMKREVKMQQYPTYLAQRSKTQQEESLTPKKKIKKQRTN